jgi:hypothetical protein
MSRMSAIQNKGGNLMPRSFTLFIGIFIIILLAGAPAVHGKAAATKKKAVAKKTAAVKGPAPVPGKRVVAEFTLAYKAQAGLKTGKIRYVGVARNAVEKRGENSVPVQFHTVEVTGTLTECGLKMKNLWEARYYRLETEWIFQDIALKSSKPAGKPKSKLPALDDATSRKLIAEGVSTRYGSQVQEVIIQGKKGSWDLCVPTYQVTAKVVMTATHDIYNTITTYECLMVAAIVQEKGAWSFVKAGCMYKGKNVLDCHCGTMCRTVSQVSSIPPLSDEDALQLMKKAFENEYGLRKNNVTVEKFTMTGRQPAGVYGTSVPCVFSAVFVIDEYRETPAGDGAPRTAEKVRAVYECTVSGDLRYSLSEKKWGAAVASCCAPGSEGCGVSCSVPYKGCRRLGTK